MSGKKHETDDSNDTQARKANSGLELRSLAEKMALTREQPPIEDLSAEEAGRLLHELSIHQIELEMQNDELLLSQAALEKSRTRYFELYDLAPVAYITLNETGLIEVANLTAAMMLEVTREKLIKSPLTRFVYSEDQEIYYLHHRRLFTGGEPQICELRLVRESGSPLWVRLEVIRTTDSESGEFICRVVISDITAFKKEEEERNRLRYLLSNIIDSMPSILVATDKNGLVTQWNAEAVRRTGLREEQALGQPIQAVLPVFADCTGLLQRALIEHVIEYDERVACSVDGDTSYSDITIYPLTADQQQGAVIRVDDTTEKVLMQEMIIQNRKMMSVGGLAAGMAHEINNPLSGMLQAAQNIENRLSPDLVTNRETAEKCGTTIETIRLYLEMRNVFEFLKGLRYGGERVAKIVDSVVQFASGNASKLAVTNLTFLLEQILELAANDYDLKTKYKFDQIELVRQYASASLEVYCAPDEIEQVILILLNNAAQALAEWRETINKPRIILRTYQDGNMAVLEIEDNGPGMSEEVKEHIFEPFFTTRAPGIGTGLGLSVSYYIIENNHKGQMFVETQAGKGTRITIRIPVLAVEYDGKGGE